MNTDKDYNSPDIVDEEIALWTVNSELPRCLMGGTRAMKEAGEKFLSKHKMEKQSVYDNRLANSTLTNGFRKTVSFLSGQVFQEDVVFSDEVPEEIKTWAESIDSKHNGINIFCKRNFGEGLGKGMSFILVDTDKTDDDPKARSKEQEKEMGLRPYFKEIKGEDVIGGRVDENGELTQFRFKETVKEAKGEFGSITVTQIRVLLPGQWGIYRQDANGNWMIHDSGSFNVNIIPIVPFIPGEETSNISGETPLMDLAELNLDHWRSSSDQRNILHVGRVPILFGKGIDIKAMEASTATMITSNEDYADLRFVEITGAAINAGREDLKDLEAKMAMYGLQQLAQRSGDISATQKAIETAESNSSLGSWALEYESTIWKAFYIAAQMFKLDLPKGSITVNKEFNFGVLNVEEITKIVELYEAGLLSAQAAFSEVRRRGFIDEHLQWQEMLPEIENENRSPTGSLSDLSGTLFGKTEEGEE